MRSEERNCLPTASVHLVFRVRHPPPPHLARFQFDTSCMCCLLRHVKPQVNRLNSHETNWQVSGMRAHTAARDVVDNCDDDCGIGVVRQHVIAITGSPCPDFGVDTAVGAHAREVAGLNFAELSELELEPFADVGATAALRARGRLERLQEQFQRDAKELTVTTARRDLRAWLHTSDEGKSVETAVGQLLADT